MYHKNTEKRFKKYTRVDWDHMQPPDYSYNLMSINWSIALWDTIMDCQDWYAELTAHDIFTSRHFSSAPLVQIRLSLGLNLFDM